MIIYAPLDLLLPERPDLNWCANVVYEVVISRGEEEIEKSHSSPLLVQIAALCEHWYFPHVRFPSCAIWQIVPNQFIITLRNFQSKNFAFFIIQY